MKNDPVCKTEVDETTAMNKAFFRGKDYYFCSAACQSQFQTNPESFGAEGGPSGSQSQSPGSFSTGRPTASEKSGEMAGQIKSAAQDIRGKAMERSKSLFDRTKNTAAGRLEGTSKAFRQTAQNFQDENPTVSRYAEKVAAKIDEASRYLREKDVEAIIQDTEHFIRNQPVLVFGAAFAMGVIAARFLKSSRQERAEAFE